MRSRLICLSLFVAVAATRARAGDFNGDGRDDLAVGVPTATVGGVAAAGQVQVFFGTGSGLATGGQILLDTSMLDPQGDLAADDAFGTSIATGDFDADGWSDLAAAAPGREVDGMVGAGVVFVLYGGPGGFVTARTQLWSQNSPGVRDKAEPPHGEFPTGENFGSELCAGDFDGDGRDDLAVTVSERVKGVPHAGAVQVFYGGANGLDATRDQLWTQESKKIKGRAEPLEEFGSELAAGDFDGDGRDELVVRTYGDAKFGPNEFAVAVLRGGPHGLRAKKNRLYRATAFDWAPHDAPNAFAGAMATGDFDGDGRDDLVVADPTEHVDGVFSAGAFHVAYGSDDGLDTGRLETWAQGPHGLSGNLESGDALGYALVARDFDGDGKCDLAVSAAHEDVGNVVDAGAVWVISGAEGGLTATGVQLWHCDVAGVLGSTETSAYFGMGLGSGDFNGDDRPDLAIGAPYHDIFMHDDAGAVHVLRGSANGGLSEDAPFMLEAGVAGVFLSGGPFGRVLSN